MHTCFESVFNRGSVVEELSASDVLSIMMEILSSPFNLQLEALLQVGQARHFISSSVHPQTVLLYFFFLDQAKIKIRIKVPLKSELYQTQHSKS